MSERIEFRARVKKPRQELSLPQLTFHHADHWMKVLGMEVFSAWLMIYTWCDREKYPKDDVSHHKNMRNIAEAFGCKVDKAQKILKTLYEFGLIDIVQEKNKYGSMKNVYYWYDIPIYADSTFCKLRKWRSWEERNSHGQELAKLRKIKEKNSSLKSRTEKSYGFDNSQENSGFQDEPYEKTVRQPYGKIVHNNVLNNNVVDEPPVEKNQNTQQPFQSKVSENRKVVTNALKEKNSTDFPFLRESNERESFLKKNNVSPEKVHGSENATILLQLQRQAEKMCGVRLTLDLLGELVKKFGEEKVKEKINMLGSVQTRNAPGFLIAALRDDYIFASGQPRQQQQKRILFGGQAIRENTQTRAREPDTAKAQRRKELIKSFYLS